MKDNETVANKASKAAEEAVSAVGAASGNFRDWANDMEDRIGDTTRRAKAGLRDTGETVREHGRHAVNAAEEGLVQGRELYREGNEAVTRRIGENSILALLAATVAGYAIGVLQSRMHR